MQSGWDGGEWLRRPDKFDCHRLVQPSTLPLGSRRVPVFLPGRAHACVSSWPCCSFSGTRVVFHRGYLHKRESAFADGVQGSSCHPVSVTPSGFPKVRVGDLRQGRFQRLAAMVRVWGASVLKNHSEIGSLHRLESGAVESF